MQAACHEGKNTSHDKPCSSAPVNMNITDLWRGEGGRDEGGMREDRDCVSEGMFSQSFVSDCVYNKHLTGNNTGISLSRWFGS